MLIVLKILVDRISEIIINHGHILEIASVIDL